LGTPESQSAPRSRRQYAFGDFSLDLDSGFLRQGVREIPLRPKPFEVLVCLVERHGKLVTKAELTSTVWPDTTVMDNTLAQCLVEIRRALSDDSCQLIRTVARRGYLFAAPVTMPLELPDRSPKTVHGLDALSSRPARRIRWAAASVLTAVLLAAASVLIVFRLEHPPPARLTYAQLTSFADSATSPAVSPDGRILAFIRSEYTFGGPGQIYVRLLPGGEPVPLTNDNLIKRGSPKFSPDGTLIAYAAAKPGSRYDTWVVPVFGGRPRLYLANASGLTWIESGPLRSRLLFSELTGRGDQMAIVTSTESRMEHRIVYMPPETGMAHRSYLSPDRKQVLVVEMDNGAWLPCRLMPFDGTSHGRPIGPTPAHCVDAAWSPDGKWMYFSADTGGGYHIWRQRFPAGTAEQITSGATEEEGIELAPDGRSFVTSIGMKQSTVWFHDARGDRQVTSEGFGLLPTISPDSKVLYYLLRAEGGRHSVIGELWAADIESGQRRRLFPEFLMKHYVISADGRRILFVASDPTRRSPVWLAELDGRFAPRQVTTIDVWKAFFGEEGEVIFMGEGPKIIYVAKEDGSRLEKIVRVESPGALFSVSPDGRWVAIPNSTDPLAWPAMLYPVRGGSPVLLCIPCTSGNEVERVGPPGVSWSPSGKFLYLRFQESMYAIPLRPGQMLPSLATPAFRSERDAALFPGAQLLPERGAFPGPDPSIYAFTRTVTHRNIYRIQPP
jgi:DNA-binding winged helix-turn-helix (wHTH) protein/Tol biopolymer transport system component